MAKALSYSEYYLFTHDKEQYYKEYILGEKREPNEKMKLGSAIHEWLDDPKYDIIKELKALGYRGKRLLVIRKMLDKAWAKRLPEQEVIIQAKMRDGTPLLAKIDTMDRENRIFADYKTTDENKRKQFWVDRDEQLSFYAYVYKLVYHKFLKEIRLYELNVVRGTCKTFYTARGPADLKVIEDKIKWCVAGLKARDWWEKRLSQIDRNRLNQQRLELKNTSQK